MVASTLNNHIVYKETREIDPEDVGHASSVYALRILDKNIAIILGKLKYTYADKNVIYIPVYAVSGLKIRSKIGVFEFESNKLIRAFKNGEVDIHQLSKPLLFDSFVTSKFVSKLNSDPEQYNTPILPVSEQVEKAIQLEDEIEEEENRFRINVPSIQVSNEMVKARDVIELGIFSIDTATSPQILHEETETEATTLRSEYRESATNNWLEKYMKNNHYRILDNEGSGDCLFAVIRDAYKQIGKNTTVDKLRAILANEITDEVFQEQYQMFLQFESNIKEYVKEMEDIKKSVSELKKRVKKMDSGAGEAKQLLDQVKQLDTRHKELIKSKTEAEKIQGEYIGYLRNVDTLDKMRAFIRTQEYWADTWAISTLERVLNMKLIIFSRESFDDKSLDAVLQCGEVNTEIEKRGSFTPEYYILASHSRRHYELISYKQKQIFMYRELPYDVKMMVLNKCLEKNAGIFYLIQDFRNLKSKLGLNPDEGKPSNDEDLEGEGRLFNSTTIFVFYSNAEKSSKPGLADGEKIGSQQKLDFVPLSKIADWRKKLDDGWMGTAISIDNHNWASVAHYMEGAKYKKTYPDIYLQFALDSGSEVSKDPKPDKASKKLKVQGDLDKKPKALKIDADYALGRDIQERETALRAKFENADMKYLLQATKHALLKYREKRGAPSQPDMILMKIRQELA
jgi:hypothetical protein